MISPVIMMIYFQFCFFLYIPISSIIIRLFLHVHNFVLSKLDSNFSRYLFLKFSKRYPPPPPRYAPSSSVDYDTTSHEAILPASATVTLRRSVAQTVNVGGGGGLR